MQTGQLEVTGIAQNSSMTTVNQESVATSSNNLPFSFDSDNDTYMSIQQHQLFCNNDKSDTSSISSQS